MQGACRVARESFDSLRDAWSSLIPTSVTPFPFQTVAWAESWWEVFQDGADLLLLGVRSGDDMLIGVAPLMIREMPFGRAVQFIGGTDVTDYLDIVASERDVHAVWSAVIQSLVTMQDAWDVLDFHCLPQWSPSQATLADLLSERLSVRVAQEEVCPILRLGGSFAHYLQALPKKERHEIRRKERNFERDAPSGRLRVLHTRDEALAALPDFFRLHRLSAPDKERFLTPAVEQFFRSMTARMADNGAVRLFMLDVDDRAVAAMYTFAAEGRLLVYNSGYDPEYSRVGAGMVLTGKMIEAAAAEGLEICDFLRGNEAYKYRFGAVDTPIWRVLAGRDVAVVDAEIHRMEAALGVAADARDLITNEDQLIGTPA